MNTRAKVSSAIASAIVLFGGWQLGNQAVAAQHTTSLATGLSPNATGVTTPESTTETTPSTGSTSSGSSTATTPSDTATTPSATASASSTDGTFQGTAVQTRFGTVQVQVTVASGKITDVTALQLTDAEMRSVQISNQAAPMLRSEVLQAQSANVQTIGGATITSDAYLTSLQAALDEAHF
ncbi:FMN-binding protein [Pseudarthrobacter sp. J1738]|uniref:FMN-binding protein n=1 Tax=unclassified Pseudarthrobacter TaxID=2647000 RepID=UPI003D28FFF8